MSKQNAPTLSGLKMLQRFIDAENNNQLINLVDGLGHKSQKGLRLLDGDAKEKGTARKLSNQGFGDFQWNTGTAHTGRYFWITENGREVLLKSNKENLKC